MNHAGRGPPRPVRLSTRGAETTTMKMPTRPHAALDIPLIDPTAIPPVDYASLYALGDFFWSGLYYMYLAMFGR